MTGQTQSPLGGICFLGDLWVYPLGVVIQPSVVYGSFLHWHSPANLPGLAPPWAPFLLGSPLVHLLPWFLQAQSFRGGLGDREGLGLLVGLEAPLETIITPVRSAIKKEERTARSRAQIFVLGGLIG